MRRFRRATGAGGFRRVLLPIVILTFVGLGIYVFSLDRQITAHFEGHRWAVPSRVYARPQELYAGAQISLARLQWELARLGYQRSATLDGPGHYVRIGRSLQLHTRAFDFWDGSEAERRFEIRFERDRISRLQSLDGGEMLNLVRLEPIFIGAIYPQTREDRVLVQLGEVPKTLVQLLLLTEDREFYQHAGVSPRGIARALVTNLKAGAARQGGSTLTQQLVKNFYLSSERTLTRKLNEAIMALLLEWHYDKDEILEAYLNEVYLGQEGRRAIHGFALASRFYFGKDLVELTVAEQALMVGLVKGPSYYDPRRHPKRARARRNVVLASAVEQGVLDSRSGERLQASGLGVIPDKPSGVTPYPAFVELIQRQLQRDYRPEDLTSAGLRLFSSLDPFLQERIEKWLSRRLPSFERHGVELQAAVMVVENATGDVVALVGDKRPRYAGFNRALDAHRPIGSLAKPAVYLTALAQPERFHLATPLDDSAVEVNLDGRLWQPKNYDEQAHGRIPLWQALAMSYNQATVRLGLELGVDSVIDTLGRLGLGSLPRPYPSLFLGAFEVSPVDITQVYLTLANGGFRQPLRAISAVSDHQGQPLGRYPLKVEQAVDPAQVYLLNVALQNVMRNGTGRRAYEVLPDSLVVAGKSGTTDDFRDSWFAGFSANYTALVWFGADDNRSIGLTGSSGALYLWRQIMNWLPNQSISGDIPEGVRWAALGEGGCDDARFIPVIDGHVPEDALDCQRDIDKGSVTRWIRSWFQ